MQRATGIRVMAMFMIKIQTKIKENYPVKTFMP